MDIEIDSNSDKTSTDQNATNLDADKIEERIFNQISNQLAQVANSVQISGVNQGKINFKIGDIEKSGNVSHCKSNGSCLFQAMAHQLHLEKFNSIQQNKSVKKLREDVVALIKEDSDAYKLQLNNTIYERMSKNELDNIAKLSKNDLNDVLATKRRKFINDLLPKPKTWGGSESMLAVSKLYQVNIFVFCEDEPFYYNNFNLQYDRTICVAYRSGRTHYDSLTSLEQQDVFYIAKTLAERVCNDLKCDILSIEDFEVEEEEFEIYEE